MTAVAGSMAWSEAAGAAALPVLLRIPTNVAFGLIGHACSTPGEVAYAEGFDPTTGFPTANMVLSTTCGGSGRGGHGPTYSADVGTTWDDAGQVYSVGPWFSAPSVSTAYDTYGNEEYQSLSSVYLQWASGFVPVPRVLGLSPVAGSIAGGVTETVTGSGFTNANSVMIGSTSVPFTVVNDTTLTFVTPPDAVTADTTLDVTVSSTQGTSATSSADQFTYTLPQVTGLSSAVGPAGGGSTITISGVGFLGASAVQFGTIPATSFAVVDDNTITATVPADTTIIDDTTLDVSVSSPAGTGAPSPADQYTYAVAPRITSITPASGPLVGGTLITIAGADLAYASQLVIGESPVYFTYNADGTISAQTPGGDAFQAVGVKLTTIGGTNAPGKAAQFTYVQGTPTLALSPTSGPVRTVLGASGSNMAPGEKLTVTYTTDIAGGPTTAVLCHATASSIGTYSCVGTVSAKWAGPVGDHTVAVTGMRGKHVDTATATFTLT